MKTNETNEFMNNIIRKQHEESEAKSRVHLKQLFGDKKSDEYIRGYREGAKMATERAIENLNTKLGIEDKQDD